MAQPDPQEGENAAELASQEGELDDLRARVELLQAKVDALESWAATAGPPYSSPG